MGKIGSIDEQSDRNASSDHPRFNYQGQLASSRPAEDPSFPRVKVSRVRSGVKRDGNRTINRASRDEAESVCPES